MLGRNATAAFGTFTCRTDTKSPLSFGSSVWPLATTAVGLERYFVSPPEVDVTDWCNSLLSEGETKEIGLSLGPPPNAAAVLLVLPKDIMFTLKLTLRVSLLVTELEIEEETM